MEGMTPSARRRFGWGRVGRALNSMRLLGSSRSISSIQDSLAFQYFPYVFKDGSNVVLWEGDMSQSMYVAELVTPFLQQDNGPLKT